MSILSCSRWTLTAVLVAMSAAAAPAQSDRPWVNPPARAEVPAKTPSGPPGQATPPPPPEPRPATEATPAVQPGRPAPAGEQASPAPAARLDQGPERPDSSATGRAAPPADAAPESDNTPPIRSARPPAAALPPEPDVAARPQGSPDQASAAQRFAIDYLAFWSAPNATALETTPDFYASRVEFYGRPMSASAILEEKRRFVRRWPERQYNPRLETMQTRCGPAALCMVRTILDFTAANPERGKRSQGTARLELGVKFQARRPVIVSETSRVDRRGQSARSEPFVDGR